jgi:hypothetical protein
LPKFITGGKKQGHPRWPRDDYAISVRSGFAEDPGTRIALRGRKDSELFRDLRSPGALPPNARIVWMSQHFR